jgi:hypothetical protein
MKDSIVEQIHQTREAIARRFGNDLHAICEDARLRQEAEGRKVVDLTSERPQPQPQSPKKAAG